MKAKARVKRRGSQKRNLFAELTAADVTAIRERRANGERPIDLAHEFGVRYQAIWSIVTRRHWKHLA